MDPSARQPVDAKVATLAGQRAVERVLRDSPQPLLVVVGVEPVFASDALRDLLGERDLAHTLAHTRRWPLATLCIGTHPEPLRVAGADGEMLRLAYRGAAMEWHGEPAVQLCLWPLQSDAPRREDVTEKSHRRSQATPGGRHLLEALDHVPDAIALFDPFDALIACNAAYVERFVAQGDTDSVLERSFDALLDANVARGLFGPAEEARRIAMLRKAWHREGAGAPLQYAVQDGTWFMSRDFRTSDGGTIVVVSDITQLHSSQDALRAMDARLHDFIDVAADWFWETDAEHRFTYLSERFEDHSGQPVAHFLGRTRAEALGAGEEALRALASLQAQLDRREPVRDFVYSRDRPDGQRSYFRISGKPVYASNGRFIGYRGSGSDITASVQATEQLHTAHSRLLDALETSLDAVALFDSDDRLVLSNSVYQAWYQTRPELAGAGHTFEALLRWSVVGGVLRDSGRDEAWISSRLDRHRRGDGSAMELQRTSGMWTEARDFRTADGGTLVVVRDVSEQKRREQALRDSEQRFRAFAEASGDWFWECDRNARLTYISAHGGLAEVARRLRLGEPLEQMAGEPTDTPRWQALRESMAAWQPFNDFQLEVDTGTATPRYLSISGRPVHGADGAPAGYRGVAREVTLRRHMEQILRTLASAASTKNLSELMRSGARSLAELFGVRYALIGELDESRERVMTRAVWAGDHFAENFSYALAGTPCADLLDLSVMLIPDHADERYPEDRLLAEMGVRSYFGVPLIAANGHMVGLLALMDGEPLQANPLIEPLPEVVAGRIAAELEREQAERRLRRSESNLRSIFEHAPVVLALKDAEGRFLRVSPTYRSMLGIEPELAIGRRPSDVLPAPQGAALEALDRQVLRSGEPLRHEFSIGSGADVRTYLVQRFPVPDGDAQVARIGIAATDITEIKTAEARTAAAYALVRTAVDSMRDGFALFDHEECLVLVNDQHRRLHAPIADLLQPGVSRRTILESLVERGGVREPPDTPREFVERCLRGAAEDTVVEYRSSDDLWLELRFSHSPHGETIVLTQDVSARKQGEQALARYRDHLEEMVAARTRELETAQGELVKSERLATIGRLAATVSHELRNPLGAVRNASFLLRRRSAGADPRISRYLDIVDRELHHSERIIEDLLETTRVKEPQLESLHLGEMVDSLTDNLDLPASVVIECPARERATLVQADRVQLRQVFANLFTNAAQAMHASGHIWLQVERGDGETRIRVRDSGPGVPTDIRERIFEPLFTTRSKGNGLGLWISREIIRRHGGELLLLSTPPPGAVFEVRLPDAGGEPDAEAAPGSTS